MSITLRNERRYFEKQEKCAVIRYEHQGIHILVILSPARTFIQAASVSDHAIIFSSIGSSCNVLESWHKNRK